MRQWGRLRSAFLVILAITALVFGTLVVIRVTMGIAIAEFTRDPLGFTEHPWYKGAVSNLGVIIWSGTAGVCFFAYALGSRSARWQEHARYLLAGGLITTLLLLDDLYMLHEVVFPEHLGIPQNAVNAAYMLILLAFIARFRTTILQYDTLLLVGALVGFGLSVFADTIASYVSISGFYIFEDGGKFFGILCWAAFFAHASGRHLTATGRVSAPEPNGSALAGSSARSRTP